MKKTIVLTLLCSIFITGFAQIIKEKKPVEAKYLAGGVPMVDGIVTFTRDLEIPFSTQEELYKKTLHWLGQYFKKEGVLTRKTLARDTTSCFIQVGINEYIVFKQNALCLDRSQMIFALAVQAKEGGVTVTMDNISYYYEEERDAQKYTAEEWISDDRALNKAKTKLLPLSAKFRTKTIDTFDELCNSLEKHLK